MRRFKERSLPWRTPLRWTRHARHRSRQRSIPWAVAELAFHAGQVLPKNPDRMILTAERILELLSKSGPVSRKLLRRALKTAPIIIVIVEGEAFIRTVFRPHRRRGHQRLSQGPRPRSPQRQRDYQRLRRRGPAADFLRNHHTDKEDSQ
jgi:hypothetical protein